MCPICLFYGVLAVLSGFWASIVANKYVSIVAVLIIGFCVYKIVRMKSKK